MRPASLRKLSAPRFFERSMHVHAGVLIGDGIDLGLRIRQLPLGVGEALLRLGALPIKLGLPASLLGQAAFVLGATLLVALLSGGILRTPGRQTQPLPSSTLGLRADQAEPVPRQSCEARLFVAAHRARPEPAAS